MTLSDGPPSRDACTTSRTCRDSVDVNTFTNSGMIAPARVPQVMIVESFHQSELSPPSVGASTLPPIGTTSRYNAGARRRFSRSSSSQKWRRWASVVKSRHSYQPSARFATWLYRLAHNRLVDHWRVAKPHDELDEASQELAGHEHETPAARAVQSEQGSRLLTALAGLAPEQREAFLLQAEGDLSLEDIAATQGVGRETVKSRLRYALVKLRKELADVWP